MLRESNQPHVPVQSYSVFHDLPLGKKVLPLKFLQLNEVVN